jgi:diguanylate cyclase (GGDEF)-like protein
MIVPLPARQATTTHDARRLQTSSDSGASVGAVRMELLIIMDRLSLQIPWVLGALKSWRTPIVTFALALIITIWSAVFVQITSEREAMRRTAYHEVNNLSLVFAQGVNRTASDLDRIIKYLRASYERDGYRADWPKLVQEEFVANRQSVQIAILDAAGKMITSTRMLYPEKPVDLSDREHFRVHVNSTEDRLFISKPLVGRASQSWSVQFTRRLTDAAGKFAGVVVISLDPSYLTRAYANVDLGQSGGLALVGDDGIVRAEGGSFTGYLGKALPTEAAETSAGLADGGVAIRLTEPGETLRITAVRDVEGFPLKIVIARSDFLSESAWASNRMSYLTVALLLTVVCLLVMVFTIRRRQQYEARLKQLASVDSLTRLSNRREFHAQLKPMLAGANKVAQPFAVHVIDLDRFKEINDLHGHPTGDKLLAAVGERIRASMRSTDTVARLGGDEFAVIQRDVTTVEPVIAVAERLCSELAKPYTIDGNVVEIGASIGSVENGLVFADIAELLRAADLALYEVKANGRNDYRLFEERMNEEAKTRREVEIGLKEALARDGFDVHYQPIVDIKSGEVTGYEALLRWRHPVRGNIPPSDFIPIAEQTGLIVEIGAWILRRACKEIARRSDDLTVSVNISAVQFRMTDMTATVARVLTETGLSASRLKVEITESLLLNHGEQTLAQITSLRALGVQVAIDDFGTGYSSLTYLQNYPVDCVKIDRSFVKNLGSGRNATAIIKAIVALASGMGMTTVAEGVETKEQLHELSVIGCCEAQGYLLSRPKLASDILPPVRSPAEEVPVLRDVA